VARTLRSPRRRLAGRHRVKPKDGWGGGGFEGIPSTAGATGGAAMSFSCEGLPTSREGLPPQETGGCPRGNGLWSWPRHGSLREMAPPGVARRGEKDAASKEPPPQTGAHQRAFVVHERRPPKRRRGPLKPRNAARQGARQGVPSRPPSLSRALHLSLPITRVIETLRARPPPLALRVDITALCPRPPLRSGNLGGLRTRTPDCQGGGPVSGGWGQPTPAPKAPTRRGDFAQGCALRKAPPPAGAEKTPPRLSAVGWQDAGGLGFCESMRRGAGVGRFSIASWVYHGARARQG
jgi:hypothetical protein